VTPGSVYGACLMARSGTVGRRLIIMAGMIAARIAMSLPIAGAAGDEDQLMGML
jgi:hypothetical protein